MKEVFTGNKLGRLMTHAVGIWTKKKSSIILLMEAINQGSPLPKEVLFRMSTNTSGGGEVASAFLRLQHNHSFSDHYVVNGKQLDTMRDICSSDVAVMAVLFG